MRNFINVGETIADARKRKGLSQKQLAERAGISQSHLARIELGTMCPTIRTAERILLELGLELRVARNTL